MKVFAVVAVVALSAVPALAQQRRDPRVEQVVERIDASRMQGTVKRLTEFGTRHTLSGTQGPGRGIVPAREWLAAQFAAIAKGSRLKPFEDRFIAQPNGKRILAPVEIVNVGAVLPGTDASREAGHRHDRPLRLHAQRRDGPEDRRARGHRRRQRRLHGAGDGQRAAGGIAGGLRLLRRRRRRGAGALGLAAPGRAAEGGRGGGAGDGERGHRRQQRGAGRGARLPPRRGSSPRARRESRARRRRGCGSPSATRTTALPGSGRGTCSGWASST